MIDNLERAEDIPAAALAAGVPFGVGDLPGVPRRARAPAVGHQRRRPRRALGAADLRDGRAGLHRPGHRRRPRGDASASWPTRSTPARWGSPRRGATTTGRRPAPAGRLTGRRWEEVEALVGTLAAAGGGVFELANESVMTSADAEARAEAMSRLRALAVATGVPTAFGVTTYGDPHRWQELLALLDDAARDGARMLGAEQLPSLGRGVQLRHVAALRQAPGVGRGASAPARRAGATPARAGRARADLSRPSAGQDFRLAREVATTSLYERIVVLDSGDAAGPIAGRRGRGTRCPPGRGDDRPRPRVVVPDLLLPDHRATTPWTRCSRSSSTRAR